MNPDLKIKDLAISKEAAVRRIAQILNDLEAEADNNVFVESIEIIRTNNGHGISRHQNKTSAMKWKEVSNQTYMKGVIVINVPEDYPELPNGYKNEDFIIIQLPHESYKSPSVQVIWAPEYEFVKPKHKAVGASEAANYLI